MRLICQRYSAGIEGDFLRDTVAMLAKYTAGWRAWESHAALG